MVSRKILQEVRSTTGVVAVVDDDVALRTVLAARDDVEGFGVLQPQSETRGAAGGPASLDHGGAPTYRCFVWQAKEQ